MSAIPAHIVVAGRVNDAQFHAAKKIVEALAKLHSNVTCETNGMFESSWERFAREKSAYFKIDHKISPIVYYNGKNYIGGVEEFMVWAAQIYQYQVNPNMVLCNAQAQKELKKYIRTSPNRFAFMDIAVGDSTSCQRVVFELFQQTCPQTCENFLSLCEGREGGPTYQGSVFHRVVPRGWVQGGDVVDGSGKHSVGGRGKVFGDESFAIDHNSEGILSMASNGSPHSNGSQFFVSLAPMPWLNHKMVAFGKVVVGMRVLRVMEKLELRQGRPVEPCTIVACGEYVGQGRRGSMSVAGMAKKSFRAESKESVVEGAEGQGSTAEGKVSEEDEETKTKSKSESKADDATAEEKALG